MSENMLNPLNEEEMKIGPNGPNAFGEADPTGATDPNVQSTDENMSINDMFQQTRLPSLPREIGAFVSISGSTGGIFALRNKKDAEGKDLPELEILRQNVAVYPSKPIKTGITQEVVQDLYAMYGKDAYVQICTMLRANANDEENTRCIEFLRNNCVDRGVLDLENIANSEKIYFNISEKVNQCILEANSKYIRTFESWVVMPFKYHASVMGLTEYIGGDNQGKHYSLNTTRVGLTRYYINPDPTDENIYVGLKDSKVKSRSSFYFADYTCSITSAIDPKNGQPTYFIFNRFGIQKNPLHNENEPMLFKFKVNVGNNTSDAGAGEGTDSGDGADLDDDI